ncbi:MAG TPA: hypothetical protein PK740_03475 [Bacteroidales bacterium]|nr:hypothetical protein [Bacteroidales bacterium]
MSLLRIEILPPSGNHGRDNNQSATALQQLGLQAPVSSKQGFVPPDSVVKSPSIKELAKDPMPVAAKETIPPAAASQTIQTIIPNTVQQVDNQHIKLDTPQSTQFESPEMHASESNLVSSVASIPDSVAVKKVPQPDTPVAVPDSASTISETMEVSQEMLNEHWTPMVETVFVQTPTLYASLLNYSPTIDHNVIHITLKNERQEEDFRGKKHQVLEYLRAHCSDQIQDVILTIDTNMETKKFILDDKDKYEELKHQNPDLIDFMKILNLRMLN